MISVQDKITPDRFTMAIKAKIMNLVNAFIFALDISEYLGIYEYSSEICMIVCLF